MQNSNVCNYCGKELDLFDHQQDFTIHKKQIQYGSGYDGDEVRLRLCCECFDSIVDSCKINPIAEEL